MAAQDNLSCLGICRQGFAALEPLQDFVNKEIELAILI